MATYTYTGNLRPGDFTSQWKLSDGRSMNIGDSLDLLDRDYQVLKNYINLVPGTVQVDLSTFPFARAAASVAQPDALPVKIVNGAPAQVNADGSTTPLADAGKELAYAERTTDLLNQNNTTYADVGGVSSIAFTIGARPVAVELFIPVVQLSLATNIFNARLVSADGATRYIEAEYFPGVAFGENGVFARRRMSTPGDYVMKLQAKVSAGSYGLKAGTYGTPIYITAVAT